MKENLSISVSVLYPLLHTARDFGIEEARLFEECSMDPSILTSAENRFTLDQYDCLIQRAAELSKDNCFGLRLGNSFSAGSGNIVTYMIQSSSHLREAILKYIEYQEVVGEAIKFHLKTDGNDAVFTLSLENGKFKKTGIFWKRKQSPSTRQEKRSSLPICDSVKSAFPSLPFFKKRSNGGRGKTPENTKVKHKIGVDLKELFRKPQKRRTAREFSKLFFLKELLLACLRTRTSRLKLNVFNNMADGLTLGSEGGIRIQGKSPCRLIVRPELEEAIERRLSGNSGASFRCEPFKESRFIPAHV